MTLEIKLADLGQNVLAPVAPDESVILTIEQARQCVDAGGVPARHAPSGCYFAPGSDNDGSGGNGGETKTWMLYLAGGVGVIGLVWLATR